MSHAKVTGRRALVTGGSGIGTACAHRLAQAGARVSIADVDCGRAEAVAAEVGGEAWHVDLADTAVAELSLDTDILVNNAGFQHVAQIQDFSPGPLLPAPAGDARGAVPAGAGGASWEVRPQTSAGSSTSPPCTGCARRRTSRRTWRPSTRRSVEGHGAGGRRLRVTSNTVCPAFVRTPLVEDQIVDQARLHGISADEVVEKVMLTVPAIKRLVEPVEVAEVVAFLCGPSASFITRVRHHCHRSLTAARLAGHSGCMVA